MNKITLYLIAFLSLSTTSVLAQGSRTVKQSEKIKLDSKESEVLRIDAKISGFLEGTSVMLLDASNNGIIDSTSIVNDRFIFCGTTTQEPKSFIIYIPLKSGVKYAYIFMANETVTVKGDLSDFPNNLTVEGSEHHKLKQDYDKSLVSFDKQMSAKNIEINELKKNKSWNDSLQKAYFDEGGILHTISQNRIQAEKLFIKNNLNTYYALEVLKYKKSEYSDKELKKLFSKFDKNIQATANGKAIQTYLDNPAIIVGDHFVDFESTNKDGKSQKFSESFDGKKFVLLDFSTPTCPNTRAALPAIKELDQEMTNQLNTVTFYTQNNPEHFNYLTTMQSESWQMLWTEKGNEGFPYLRYRINATPTYLLFNPQGKLIERWSGYKKGNSDDTTVKIKNLMQIK